MVTTRSSQPQRRARPVVVPNSSQWFLAVPPSLVLASPSSSVGKGPVPTRVVNALITPCTSFICHGGMPLTGRTATGGSVGTGYKRIGTKINIKHGSLRPFKEYLLLLFESLLQVGYGIGNIWAQFVGCG